MRFLVLEGSLFPWLIQLSLNQYKLSSPFCQQGPSPFGYTQYFPCSEAVLHPSRGCSRGAMAVPVPSQELPSCLCLSRAHFLAVIAASAFLLCSAGAAGLCLVRPQQQKFRWGWLSQSGCEQPPRSPSQEGDGAPGSAWPETCEPWAVPGLSAPLG